jgi:release factor glutamine methyltransferase
MRLDHGIDITTLPDVYEPSEDSYLMLEVVEVAPGQRFLEIGCGTGLISLHAAKIGAAVTATDISRPALDCARRNAAKNDLRLTLVESDLFEKVRGIFDVIAFNPPYLPSEGRSTSWMERSWCGGETGSETATRFLSSAWRHLAPGGSVYLILSSFGGFMAALKAAKERYEAELLAEKHMFFESVYAYRLKLRHFGV